ncbi:MAG: MscS Mechanosensitive ion channel [Francisellaceae bacterium]|nr:MscS Mechanosensitive ion channel [Francisellaceae bacterium]
MLFSQLIDPTQLFANLKLPQALTNCFEASLFFVSGFVVANIVGSIVAKITLKRASAHHSMLLKRVVYYFVVLLFIMLSLKTLGVEVGTLLGAAGIGAVAISFASQTGMSNIISGIFLIIEKPFVVGDFIVINDTIGEILSIELLSINIRTRDNTLVRIPNELLLKSQFQNLSRFPIRRLDLTFRFSFDEDIDLIKKILFEAAQNNPLSLESPLPEFFFLEFGESGISIQFSIYARQTNYTELKTNIQLEIQKAFKAHHIVIPFYYQTIAHDFLMDEVKPRTNPTQTDSL